MKLIFRLLLTLAVLLGTPAHAQSPDPRADWRSAETAHFRFHYRAEHRAQAEQLGAIAERVHTRVTDTLAWQPQRTTEVVLVSESDLANGLTTPLPFNHVAIYLAQPEGELLDNSDWLELVFTHEYVHVVHLDKARGLPLALRSVFGRMAWFFPNLFAPSWTAEGLAVFFEGDPATDRADVRDRPLGRGRLGGPAFEAFLRAEQARGFPTLAEINAQGRRLPLTKAYLYGAYFYEFLARNYGNAAVPAWVERYSGNIVPRLHSNPAQITGKTLDVLWDEFLADLNQRLTTRSAALRAQPEQIGRSVQPLQFEVSSVAALPGGDTLAVLDDGLGAPQLARISPNGQRRDLARVQSGARLDVAADGSVLLAQPDLCEIYTLAYDLYRVDVRSGAVQRLTECARLLRGVTLAAPAGPRLLAIQHFEARTRLVEIDAAGQVAAVRYQPPAGQALTDLVAAPDGRQVSVIARQGGDWRVLVLDVSSTGTLAAPRELLHQLQPIYALRHGAQGLELIATADGVPDVWRITAGGLQRLTRSHTAVLDHAGTQADGSLALAVLAGGGTQLQRMDRVAVLEQASVHFAAAAAASTPAAAASPLGAGEPYAPWRTLYPRSWWPVITADRGLTAYGASTFGSDALGAHQYAAQAQWETSQREPLGQVEYLYRGSQLFAFGRSLTARGWTGAAGRETTTLYDRRTQAQWLGLWPLRVRHENRLLLGTGAVLDRTERVQAATDASRRLLDTQLGALLLDYDTRGGNWWSEGANRGQHSSLLYESYRPFSSNNLYDGHVLRADARGYFALGRSVLALRYTEARASGRTEPFQLGGATDALLQLGPTLNRRDLALRGYAGNEAVLLGANARIASVEWRQTLADIDRHAMVPPLGINRLSAAAFMDVGGAWNSGSGPDRYRRGVGLELLGEVKLLYALDLQLRLGVARGLDAPSQTLGYLNLGRSF